VRCPSAVGTTTPVSDSEVDAYVKLRDQVRDFRYFFVSTPPEIATAAISDDELEKYYAAHQDAYMTPEQVSLDYIELDAASLEAPADADEATLKARYEEQKARYTVKEQRLASHILVSVDKKAAADAQKQAQEKAAALAAEARAGKDFAELAKASSDDLGSKNQGGDLGWIEQGMMQGAFDEALFKLETGKVSDPVLTDEGFHVILVREVKPGSQRSFEEVRAELLKEYQDTERESRYNDIAGRLNDLVFQNQGSLDPVAEALNLKIQHTAMFGRQGGQGIAADPNVLKKAFSDAVLVDGNVSDPIDLGPNRQVVIRVAEHKPKAARALSEVKEQVLARLRSEKIAAGAKERADALRKRIAEGADFDKLMQEAGATATSAKAVGRRAVNQDPALVQEAFKLPRPAEGKPSLAVVSIPRDRYGVIEVGGAQDGDVTKLDDAQRKAVREELARNIGASEVRSMIDVLRARTQVKVVEDRL
jgi:peptidyl-prolyl cis-trans isomerase D